MGHASCFPRDLCLNVAGSEPAIMHIPHVQPKVKHSQQLDEELLHKVCEDLGLQRDGSLMFASLELGSFPPAHSSSTSPLYPPGFKPHFVEVGPSFVGP